MEESKQVEELYAAWIGLDWADEEHAWTLRCGTGQTRERGKLAQTPEAIEVWAASLAARFPGGRIAIALEQKRGALIYALSKYEHLTLFPVPPLMSSRYRAAMYPSGRKNDPIDGDLLLDLLSAHRDKLSPLQLDSAPLRKLQLLVEHRRELVDQRTAYTNQLRSQLKMYFPQVLGWFDELDAPIFAAFLERWPTLAQAQTASREQLLEFFHAHRSRSAELIEKRIASLREARPLTSDAAIIESLSLLVQSLLPLVAHLNTAIADFERTIRDTVASIPDYAIFTSFPGAGENLAPRLLAAFGSRRERWPSPQDMSTFSGIAPVTVASGRSERVSSRRGCPKFLRQTFHEYAASSLIWCDWAKAFYDRQRAKGNKHHAAVRSLAFKWIRILHACWRSSTPYDDQHYTGACALRQTCPPCSSASSKEGKPVRALFKTQDGFQKFSGLDG